MVDDIILVVVYSGVIEHNRAIEQQRPAPMLTKTGPSARHREGARSRLLDVVEAPGWHDRATLAHRLHLPYSHLANLLAKLCAEGVLERKYPRHRGLAAASVPQAYRLSRHPVAAPHSPKMCRSAIDVRQLTEG